MPVQALVLIHVSCIQTEVKVKYLTTVVKKQSNSFGHMGIILHLAR